MVEYKFESIYLFVDIIYQSVKSEVEFRNFDVNDFIKSATTFQKKSLLHIYVESTSFNYYLRNFRKNGDCYEEEDIDEWKSIFTAYNVSLVIFLIVILTTRKKMIASMNGFSIMKQVLKHYLRNFQ